VLKFVISQHNLLFVDFVIVFVEFVPTSTVHSLHCCQRSVTGAVCIVTIARIATEDSTKFFLQQKVTAFLTAHTGVKLHFQQRDFLNFHHDC
jgi:hypothetical protein